MKESRYNFIIPLKNTRNIIVNTFSGAIDVVSNHSVRQLRQKTPRVNSAATNYLLERRYLLENGIDELMYAKRIYKALLRNARCERPLHFTIITSFRCNIKCTYCWQQHKVERAKDAVMTKNKIDSVVHAIHEISNLIKDKSDSPPIIQLFGGEPLLMENKAVIEYILTECINRGWKIQVTSNGVNLKQYYDLFEKFGIDQLQVTIDGYEDIHNLRRVGSKYGDLMSGIDTILHDDYTHVKLRTNVDLSNVGMLSELAKDIIKRHWYTNNKFYAYVAPLRGPSFDDLALLKNRPLLLQQIFDLSNKFPQLGIFDFMGWDGYQPVRVLEVTGQLPYPRTQICETNLNQFVFSPAGEIHVCSEEAHDTARAIGHYWPKYEFDKRLFHKWYNNSPLKLANCASCNLLPLCGGGCQLTLKNHEFLKVYCQVVKDAFTRGMVRYAKKEKLI